MARVEQTQGFYQKMAELQEKLKKSEEERLKLEEKFVLMMKSCREEEEMRIRALRDKYERFLEEDKRRRDRNERILQTLDRIESRAGALSAKSERLKLLRKHYEAYLIKMYPLWKNPPKYPEEKLPPYPAPSLDTLRSDFQSNNFRPESALSQTSSQVAAFPWQLPAHQAPVPPHVPERNGHWLRASSPTAAPPFDKTSTAVAPGDPLVNGYRVPPGQDAEVKDDIPAASNPVLDGALDGYLHRAAEILRVPVQELDATSEKRDEEKSVHTEQDTSRDLLGVSLSDDNDSAAKEELEMPCEPAIEPTEDNKQADAASEPAAAPAAIDARAGGDTTCVQAPPDPVEAHAGKQLGQGEAGDFVGEIEGETVDHTLAEAVHKPAEPETTRRLGPGDVPGGEVARSTQGPADCLDTQTDVAPENIAESLEQNGASVAIHEEVEYASELAQQEGAGDNVDYDPAENVELATEQSHDDTVSQGHADQGNEEWYTQEQVQGDSEMIAEYDDTTEQGENVPQAYNDNTEENYADDAQYQPYTQGQEYTENADQYANNELGNDAQYDYREATEPQGPGDAETYPDVQYNENVEQPQADDGQQYTEQDYAEDPQQPYVQQQYSDNVKQTQSMAADREEAFVEDRQEQQAGECYPDEPQQDTEQFPENILQDTSSEVLQEEAGGAEADVEEETPDTQGETHRNNEDNAIEEGQGKGGVVGGMAPPEGEEESEESSSSFWNPPGRKVRGEIPSVDELASNVPAAAPEDSSESSVDSRQHPTTTTVPSEGGAQPLRKLLGAPTDAAAEPSDADDVEDELAALIQGQPASGVPQSAAEVDAKALKSEAKPPVRTPSSPNTQALKKNKPQKAGGISDKPSAKATSKKLPALNRVLESDTESLNLDAGAGSNVDSDEFDFSTE